MASGAAAESWQRGFQQLLQDGVLSGYALVQHHTQCEIAHGILAERATASSFIRNGATEQDYSRLFSADQEILCLDILGCKAIVFKQTARDLYAITRRKHMGVCVNNLPFGVVVSIFQKPQLPQLVIPSVELVCAKLRL